MTNKQDWHVCELSQAGIARRAYVPGPYSNREDLLYAFDRFIVEFHDAIADGVRKARSTKITRQPIALCLMLSGLRGRRDD